MKEEVIYTCTNCGETYNYELPICPGCQNENFEYLRQHKNSYGM